MSKCCTYIYRVEYLQKYYYRISHIVHGSIWEALHIVKITRYLGIYKMYPDQRDGSAGKGPAAKAEDLSSSPGTHVAEGEN